MLHWCSPEQAKNADGNLYIHINKRSEEGYSALSPYTTCEGVVVPGTNGEVIAPSAFAAYNVAKVVKGERNLHAIKVPEAEHKGDGAAHITDPKSGRVVGLDRTKELYVYNNREINYLQARWAVFMPAYEQFLRVHKWDLLCDLHETVEMLSPNKVYLYDLRGTIFGLNDPRRTVSSAWLLAEVYNRVFRTLLTDDGESETNDTEDNVRV